MTSNDIALILCPAFMAVLIWLGVSWGARS